VINPAAFATFDRQGWWIQSPWSGVIVPSSWHFMLVLKVDNCPWPGHHREGSKPMDDYQEEWLELRAAEQDPLEPADDATEL
jgi:hypothetical protein